MTRALRLLALCALLLLGGCMTELTRGLSERDANEQVALLLQNGIPAARRADPKSGSLTVLVEQSRFADAVQVLRANGLPRPRHQSIAEVFQGRGLVASPTEERARLIYALGEELARTIGEIDGVLTARVHIVLAENDPLRRDLPPASAAVFIRHRPEAALEPLVPQIKMLVANGVAGLTYDKVSVVMVPAEALPLPAGRPEGELVAVMGLWVQPGSARLLQAVLAGGAAAILALLLLAGWLGWRMRAQPKPGFGLVPR